MPPRRGNARRSLPMTAAVLGAMLAALVVPAHGQQDPSLVASFACDQPLVDTSQRGATVVDFNATYVPDRFGRPNQALRFNGSSNFVLFNVPSLPRGSAPRTLSLWVKSERINATPGNGNDHFAGWGANAPSQAFGFFFGLPPYRPQLYGYLGVNDTLTTTITESRWLHVTHTYDGTTARVYVNGQSVGQRTLVLNTTGGTLFSIGGRIATEISVSAIRGYFAGSIDDVRIWNRSLSAAEVANLHLESANQLSPPVITVQPIPQNLFVGQALQLTVNAAGAGPFSYQWLRNGSVITDATTATYLVATATAADSGTYSAVVANAYGSAYSTTATLTVSVASAPAITLAPQAASATAGATVSFSVEATGNPSPSYQWFKDGAPLSGATRAGLNLAAVSSANAGTYTVTLSNTFGTVTSAPATLTVTPQVSAPVFVTQPRAQTVTAGTTVVLTASVTGSPAPAFQWLRNGAPIPGATGSALVLAGVSSADAGVYGVTAANGAGTATSGGAALVVNPENALANLSIRTGLTGGQTLIVGAVISGGTKSVLVRAAGPALNRFGLTGMTDPRLELYAGQALVGSNNDWPLTLAPTFARVGAFAFDAGSRDAAFTQPLTGAFTVQAKGTGAGTVLVEAYDATGGVTPRLVNLSARNFVGTGSDILIAGFALSGSGTKQVLIRAVGPALTAFGVPGALEDPRLEVYDGSGRSLAANDNWGTPVGSAAAATTATFAQVGAFPLAAGSRDAALLITLNAGASYTVQVAGVNNTTGEALIEVYEVF